MHPHQISVITLDSEIGKQAAKEIARCTLSLKKKHRPRGSPKVLQDLE
jgi:hypothetical protein